jgi:hypothetical protein
MKDKNELLSDAGLVRDIEAWCQVKYPADDTERNFRDALFRKTFAELPAMEIQHVRHHDLKKYRHIKVPAIPLPKKEIT